MSSSSESDDEEAKRIREAVSCCESRADIFKFKTDKKKTSPSAVTSSSSAATESVESPAIGSGNKTNHIKKNPEILKLQEKLTSRLETNVTTKVTLKSKRPHFNEDNDEDSSRTVLQTTPEFRAFVAKNLEKQLDKEMETCLAGHVWDCKGCLGDSEEQRMAQLKGPKLLSNSTTPLGDPSSKDSSQPLPKLKSSPIKKPRLSTSSESSDDEKIQACVFTIHDIEVENKRLESLAKERKEELPEKSIIPNEASPKNECGTHESNGKAKKKKKKSEIKDANVS